MRKSLLFSILIVVSSFAIAEETPRTESLRRGLDYLLSHQEEDGHFSDSDTPALTALPLWAAIECARSGVKSTRFTDEECAAKLERAAKFIISRQLEDGSFRQKKARRVPGGLSTYNTAVCLTALFEYGKAPREALLKARKFLAASQLQGDDTMAGGFGYGPATSPRRYADLSNTAYALDAMRRTEGLEEFRQGEGKIDVDWTKAVAFVENLQESDGPRKGGAAYNERTPQGGSETNGSGRVRLMAYGSMSYAAVMVMAHAKLTRGDARVKNALSYCEKYWTIDENPGMGSQGLYYYFDILSRALSAAGVEKIGDHLWKRELSDKIVSLQKSDDSWSNTNNRFWEADPVLCTSFALICLSLCR